MAVISDTSTNPSSADPTAHASYDVIVIGAGVSGLYQLYRLREAGFHAHGYEAGDGVGGTWYWNRYPGCRFDSESWSYGYSWSKEVLQEWDWTEHFSPQPETEKYLNYVADRFAIKDDFSFGARLEAAHWDDEATRWRLRFGNGTTADCQFLVTALGALSAPTLPNVPGIDDFEGPSFHTARWPKEPVDFTGKRVAVVGTGATGVQLIQEVAKTAKSLTVFQRTPNWCAPLHNSRITPEEMADIKARYDEIFERCNSTFSAFIHDSDRRKAVEVSEQERHEFFEELYASPGFGIWFGNFRDTLVDETANAMITDFVTNKIRERVKDPAVADKLIPTDHGFGTRRVPMETKYFEVYNQDNVRLVDLRETPISKVTAKGIDTTAESFEFDLICYATGFDAVTGAFDRIDFQGVGGRKLKEFWAEGPRTYLGLTVPGFPNLFTLVGPHNAATFSNMPRCIEQNVEWVTPTLVWLREHGHQRIEATPEAEQAWTQEVLQASERMLFTKVNSWFMGVNKNVEGKQVRRFMLYAGGAPKYREICDEVAADGFRGFDLR